jgi:hypothetical protein
MILSSIRKMANRRGFDSTDGCYCCLDRRSAVASASGLTYSLRAPLIATCSREYTLARTCDSSRQIIIGKLQSSGGSAKHGLLRDKFDALGGQVELGI